MELLKIISIALSCFSLGLSVYGLVYSTITLKSQTKAKKDGESRKDCGGCKHFCTPYNVYPCCDCETHEKWEPRA